MKKRTRYQGTYTDVEITSGTGNARRFGREAKFLAHYGSRLATLLREDRLRATSVDEGTYVNAVFFQEDPRSGTPKIEGIFSKQNLEMDEALNEITWKK